MSGSRPKLANEAEYNLRARIPDYEDYFARYREESAAARAALPCELDIVYGDGLNMTLDVFPAAQKSAPILVFIHGGYWRGMDKSDFSFPAAGFVDAGVSYVSVNYGLAPALNMEEIVAQCRAAMEWVGPNAARCNGDAERIHVSGHSAGGHLTGMMLATDWAARGQRADLVKGGCAISGVFDLRPILETSINDDIRLDEGTAARFSPALHLPAVGAPLISAVGADETDAFVQQSRDFADAWSAKGFSARYMPLEGFHHFDVVLELGRRDSALTRAVLEQIGV